MWKSALEVKELLKRIKNNKVDKPTFTTGKDEINSIAPKDNRDNITNHNYYCLQIVTNPIQYTLLIKRNRYERGNLN
ncbi:hypothetical protein EBO34_03345 [Alteribacter keqinensis]|uniref:Uncharacterized protein n=1 Tax=Alteribacter keqinensis TaxID=2483800 RepID=A0A3M7TTN8_9BACI|nr:hypothetical protein EBO34_03345 [Alteribacter keqinensis]